MLQVNQFAAPNASCRVCCIRSLRHCSTGHGASAQVDISLVKLFRLTLGLMKKAAQEQLGSVQG